MLSVHKAIPCEWDVILEMITIMYCGLQKYSTPLEIQICILNNKWWKQIQNQYF